MWPSRSAGRMRLQLSCTWGASAKSVRECPHLSTHAAWSPFLCPFNPRSMASLPLFSTARAPPRLSKASCLALLLGPFNPRSTHCTASTPHAYVATMALALDDNELNKKVSASVAAVLQVRTCLHSAYGTFCPTQNARCYWLCREGLHSGGPRHACEHTCGANVGPLAPPTLTDC